MCAVCSLRSDFDLRETKERRGVGMFPGLIQMPSRGERSGPRRGRVFPYRKLLALNARGTALLIQGQGILEGVQHIEHYWI